MHTNPQRPGVYIHIYIFSLNCCLRLSWRLMFWHVASAMQCDILLMTFWFFCWGSSNPWAAQGKPFSYPFCSCICYLMYQWVQGLFPRAMLRSVIAIPVASQCSVQGEKKQKRVNHWVVFFFFNRQKEIVGGITCPSVQYVCDKN